MSASASFRCPQSGVSQIRAARMVCHMPRRKHRTQLPATGFRWPRSTVLLAELADALGVRPDLPPDRKRALTRAKAGSQLDDRVARQLLGQTLLRLIPPVALRALLKVDQSSEALALVRETELALVHGKEMDTLPPTETFSRFIGVVSSVEGLVRGWDHFCAGQNMGWVVDVAGLLGVSDEADKLLAPPTPSRRLVVVLLRQLLMEASLRHACASHLLGFRLVTPAGLWARGSSGQKQYLTSLLDQHGKTRGNVEAHLEAAADPTGNERPESRRTVQRWFTGAATPRTMSIDALARGLTADDDEAEAYNWVRLRLRSFFALRRLHTLMVELIGEERSRSLADAYDRQVPRFHELAGLADLGSPEGRQSILRHVVVFGLTMPGEATALVQALRDVAPAESRLDLAWFSAPYVHVRLMADAIENADEMALARPSTRTGSQPLGLSGPLGLDSMVRE